MAAWVSGAAARPRLRSRYVLGAWGLGRISSRRTRPIDRLPPLSHRSILWRTTGTCWSTYTMPSG